MRIEFVTGNTPKAQGVIDAISAGVRSCGDEIETISGDEPPDDLDCDFVGLYGLSRPDWLQYCMDRQQPFIYFDKGYRRQDGFWRVGLNETHPAEYIYRARHNSGRVTKLREAMGLPLEMPSWRTQTATDPIIIASSSEKFHALHGLPPPREWVAETIREVRKHTKRPIFYRPKPSWGDPGPIEGSRCVVDIKEMSKLFRECHALITYGSYICLDAMLEGVPSIVLGNGVIRHISSTDLAEIEEPRLASDEERAQVLANLAWCQYTLDEWRNGIAWRSTRRLFLHGDGAQ